MSQHEARAGWLLFESTSAMDDDPLAGDAPFPRTLPP